MIGAFFSPLTLLGNSFKHQSVYTKFSFTSFSYAMKNAEICDKAMHASEQVLYLLLTEKFLADGCKEFMHEFLLDD